MNLRRRMMMNQRKFWIYKPGHSDFINCTYALGTEDYLNFPPQEECAVYRYSNSWGASSVSWLSLNVNRTFKGFSKLCFEAKVREEQGAPRNPDGIEISNISSTRQALSTERAYYEIDLSEHQNENEIRINLHSDNAAFIYKMWTE